MFNPKKSQVRNIKTNDVRCFFLDPPYLSRLFVNHPSCRQFVNYVNNLVIQTIITLWVDPSSIESHRLPVTTLHIRYTWWLCICKCIFWLPENFYSPSVPWYLFGSVYTIYVRVNLFYIFYLWDIEIPLSSAWIKIGEYRKYAFESEWF